MSSLAQRRKGAAGILLAWLLLAPGARADQVLISKIMYHPPGDWPEYVELHNNTANAIDIADWRLKGGIEYKFPAFAAADPLAGYLKPFERVVLSMADARTTRDAYRIPANVRIFGPWVGRLNKQGDRLRLLDKNGLTISTVKYLDRAPWPAVANGGGHALVIRSADGRVDDWRNWTVSTRPGGGPGTESGSANEAPVGNPELITQSGESIVVDYDSNWAITTGVDMTQTKWKELAFPDRQWLRGPGLVGFGTTKVPPPGIRTLVRAGFVTYYLRHVFIYNGPPGAAVSVDAIVDDGAVFYLNNQEVGRVRMPGGPVRANTAAATPVADANEEKSVLTINPAALVRGTNILAVEVHQYPGQNPDLAFGMRLKVRAGGPALARSVLINEVFPGPPGVNFIEFFNSGSTPVNLKGHFLLPGSPASLAPNARRYQVQQDVVIRPKSFGVLDMMDAGVWPRQPVVAYLVAPDGRTVLHAINSVVPTDGRSLGQRPDGSGQWFLLAQPSPDAANAKQTGLVGALKINEVHLGRNGVIDWVEVFNAGTNKANLGGHFLASKPGFADKVTLVGELPPKGVKSFPVSFPAVAGDVTVFLAGAENIVLDAHVFHVSQQGEFFSAFPDGSGEFLVDTKPTRDQTNNPARNSDIVINEIMYKPPDTQGKGEYVELFNRGKQTVNLGDWVLTGGIDFIFPPDTKLKPGGYLVIAADAGLLRSFHGAINVLGNFSGKLSNAGELLRLLDAKGNLVDLVDYETGGDWPELAAGRGSSLELIHPDMDNSRSSAWAASDEANKSRPRTYTHRATYTEQLTLGEPSDYRELHLFLNSSGHAIVSDVELRKDGTGPNVLTNTTRGSTTGRSDAGWLWQGNHWASRLDGGQLHIISEGHGDNRVNRVEIDAPGLVKGNLYELKFTARWVSGSHLLVAHTWDWSVAKVFPLDVPSNLGTPGRPNSRAATTPVAQADDLAHYPAVPRTTDTVKVTVRVHSVMPGTAVVLFHRAPDADNKAPWQNKPMFDNATGGDDVAGDGVFSALLPEYKADKQIVEFYVEARSPSGAKSILPRRGAETPALYVVDNQNVPRDLRTQRFVISPASLDALGNGNTNKHQFRFPRLSNRYYNMTFIANERDVFHNARVHPAGSSFTRDTSLNRAKWKLPADRAFRSHTKFSWDNNSLNTRLLRWMLYQVGHPVNESEMVRHLINGGPVQLMEDVEPIGNDFLNRVFKDGTQGELYRTSYMFFYRDDGQGSSLRNGVLAPNYGDDPLNYKVVWSKRTREAENDYTALLAMLRTMAQPNFTEADARRHFDLEMTFRNWAVRGFAKDSDTFSMGTSHNCFFYRKPTDGRFMCFMWDADFAFGGFDPKKPEGYWGGNVQNLMNKPWAQRLFYYYLAEIVEQHSRSSPKVTAYLRAEEEASNAYTVPAVQFQTFFNARAQHAVEQMGPRYQLEFKITTNNGQPLTTDAPSLTLDGQSPYGVFTVVMDGQPRAKLEWLDDAKWRMHDVGLSPGVNELVLRGVDQWGNPKRTAKITVTKGAAPAAKSAAAK